MDKTQTTSNEQVKSFFPSDRSFWIAVILALCVFLFFVVLPLSPFYRTRHLYVSVGGLIVDAERQSNSGGVSFILLILLWALIGGILVGTCRSLYARVWTLLVLFGATGLMAVSTFFGMWWFASQRPLAGTQLNDHWYHLEYHFSFDRNFYSLVQCDEQDTNCKTVDTDIPNDYSSGQRSELVANLKSNSVAVVIDGATIYTYTPQ